MTVPTSNLERAQAQQAELERQLLGHSMTFLSEGLSQLATVAASALAILVTFRESLVGTDPQLVWLVKGSWVSLGLAVVGAIASKLNVAALLGVVPEDLQGLRKLVGRLQRGFLLRRLSLVAFVVGIACLIAFGIANL